MGDLWQPRAESLLGAGHEVPPPLARAPERALGIAAVAFLGEDKMQGRNSEGRRLLKDLPRRLRARQPNHQAQGIEGRRLPPHAKESSRADSPTETSVPFPRGPLRSPASNVPPGPRRRRRAGERRADPNAAGDEQSRPVRTDQVHRSGPDDPVDRGKLLRAEGEVVDCAEVLLDLLRLACPDEGRGDGRLARTQARAICASDCPRARARTSSARIFFSFSSVMCSGLRNRGSRDARASAGIPPRWRR